MSVDVIAESEKLSAAYASNPPTAGATLIHACIAKLKSITEIDYVGDLYRTDYAVEGQGQFPFDMLRYVCSWPAREEDEAALMGGHDAPLRRARLSTYHRDPTPQLAEVRWSGKFCWHVVDVVQTVAL